MPKYFVGADGGEGSTTLRSSCAISRPSASAAVRSTCLASTGTAASLSISSADSWKLTIAADPTMRVVAGDSDVPSRPSALSRGQKPASQSSQW